jgi:hypothetical protein
LVGRHLHVGVRGPLRVRASSRTGEGCTVSEDRSRSRPAQSAELRPISGSRTHGPRRVAPAYLGKPEAAAVVEGRGLADDLGHVCAQHAGSKRSGRQG